MLNKTVKLNPGRCIYKLSSDVAGKVFDSENDMLHELNEEGTVILRLIDNKRTNQDILDCLYKEYSTNQEEIKDFYLSFINDAEKLGMIVLE